MIARDKHATIVELLEAVFSVRSVPRLYNEGQRSLEMTVRRVGGWCEMAASLRGNEPRSRGTYTCEGTEN
jgi:hypothetical protein